MTEQLRPDDDINKQGVKFDDGKIRLDLIPPELVFGVGSILSHGARKYSARNWEMGMSWSRPFAGALRHLWKWWAGERLDVDSGEPHLWHAACNLAFLIAYEERNVGSDDRPVHSSKPSVHGNPPSRQEETTTPASPGNGVLPQGLNGRLLTN